ncbi:MAG TPA: hypothetical protein VFZ64_15330 [Nocardioidaceae bacterium]
MRTDELRTLLREHGEASRDKGSRQRLSSVHDRVGRMRRRRRAVAVGTVAAAAMAMVGVVLPGTEAPEPAPAPARAPSTLAGHDVPAAEVSLGYTYEYVRGVEGDADRPLRLQLPASDGPRLVMWASSADSDARLRLRIPGRDHDVVRPAGDFESFELLPANTSHQLVLRQDGAATDGRIALAVFDLSEHRPAGVTKDGVTFRQEILGDRLLAAAIGDPGEAVVRTEFTMPEKQIGFSPMCQGRRDVDLRGSYQVRLLLGGEEWVTTGCDGRLRHDEGADGIWMNSEPLRRWFEPGEQVPLEARLVRVGDPEGRPVEAGEVVLGVAAYAEEDRETFRAAGFHLPERREHAGHEWVRSFVGESDPGQGVRTVSVSPGDKPMLLVVAVNGLARAAGFEERVALVVDGERRDSLRYSSEGGWGPDLVLEPDQPHEVEVRVTSGRTDETQVALVLYELVH